MCDQLKVEYDNHTTFEYYNADSIRIDPGWFADFKRGDQYKIDDIQRSIFLRSERHYPAAVIISEAVKVQPELLDAALFEVPREAILLQVK